MGRVSFALADAAIEAGAVLAAGVEVAAIEPGEGVVLAGGELIRARAVVSNADPKRTVALCATRRSVPAGFRRRVDGWRTDSPVVKINCGLQPAPDVPAPRATRPRTGAASPSPPASTTPRPPATAARRGEPAPTWCELYFQSVYDPSIAPARRRTP